MYTITLNDGTVISNVKLNGNTFVCDSVVDKTLLENNLTNIVVSSDNSVQTLKNTVLVRYNRTTNGCQFILREKTLSELVAEGNDANITDIQLALAELYELIAGGVNNG